METMNLTLEEKVAQSIVKNIDLNIDKLGYFCDSDGVDGNSGCVVNDYCDEYEEESEEEIDRCEVWGLVTDALDDKYKYIAETDDWGQCDCYYVPISSTFTTIQDVKNHFNLGE